MSVELGDPLVTAYLARLESLAAVLPEGRAAELLADIRGHLVEALAGVPTGDAAGVRAVLGRLGDPEDIVEAEALAEAESTGRAGVSPPYLVGGSPVPGVGGLPQGSKVAGSWGALELAAVLLLTVGHVVLWVVGPIGGLVLAWLSPRWTRREKIVATVWTTIPLAIVVVGAFLSFFAGSTSVSSVVPAP